MITSLQYAQSHHTAIPKISNDKKSQIPMQSIVYTIITVLCRVPLEKAVQHMLYVRKYQVRFKELYSVSSIMSCVCRFM